MKNRFLCAPLLCTLALAQASWGASVAVKVSAPALDVREAPVSVVISAAEAQREAPAGGEAVDGQLEDAPNGQKRLTFVTRDLKAGASRLYRVRTDTKPVTKSGIELKRVGEDVEFWVDGQLFTRYDTSTGPNKPYFYPLLAPGNRQVVRHWPVEKEAIKGETRDHPHHRGLWFAHGKLNGVDFWTEQGKVGKTVHTGFQVLESGPVFGLMRATTDWLAPDGRRIATDSREVRVYKLRDATLMDLSITVRASDGPLLWSDTKEGLLGLRVADSMRAEFEKRETGTPQGQMLNSEGQKQNAAWGKAATWCDYSGPVDGETVGVAILDAPQNLRHPTPWHARGYGLLAANPFALHDFDSKQPRGAGDLETPANASLTFSYRLIFHRGDAAQADIAGAWNAFATPPQVAR